MGARTPEELEVMLEDAFLTWDRAVLGELFEEGAVVLTRDCNRPARGIDDVKRRVAAMWARGHTFVAGAGTLLLARALGWRVGAAIVARRFGGLAG